MQILMNTGGLAMTNSFVIADESTKVAVMFDAPDHTALPLVQQCKARGWDLIGLWLTHAHFDHVADHEVVTSHFPGAKVLVHRLDEPKLQHIDVQMRMFGLPIHIAPRSADGYLEDGQDVLIGALRARVLHTPGHSPGHVAFHFADENVLVGGDLIIGGSIGRTDFPDCDERAMARSLRRVMDLPPATRLLPGHGPISTLAEEARTNEALRAMIGGA